MDICQGVVMVGTTRTTHLSLDLEACGRLFFVLDIVPSIQGMRDEVVKSVYGGFFF